MNQREQRECIRAWLVRNAPELNETRPGWTKAARAATGELGFPVEVMRLKIMAVSLKIQPDRLRIVHAPTKPEQLPVTERLLRLERLVELQGIAARALMKAYLVPEDT